ncbi:MAG: hypothetical protein ACLSCV_04205 [Acutalibacteraceae bacterium]
MALADKRCAVPKCYLCIRNRSSDRADLSAAGRYDGIGTIGEVVVFPFTTPETITFDVGKNIVAVNAYS